MADLRFLGVGGSYAFNWMRKIFSGSFLDSNAFTHAHWRTVQLRFSQLVRAFLSGDSSLGTVMPPANAPVPSSAAANRMTWLVWLVRHGILKWCQRVVATSNDGYLVRAPCILLTVTALFRGCCQGKDHKRLSLPYTVSAWMSASCIVELKIESHC